MAVAVVLRRWNACESSKLPHGVVRCPEWNAVHMQLIDLRCASASLVTGVGCHYALGAADRLVFRLR